MKEKIKKELKNRFLYLKFDCATRLRVNYLGLNVRFVDDQGLGVTRTLALVDNEGRHTSGELKKIVNGVLQDYDIPLANIICCVTDNATNMVSMMKEDLQHAEEGESENDEKDDNETMAGTLDLESSVPINCEHMRCAVHILQLAIHDGLKKTASGVIAKLRHVAKEALSPKINQQLRRRRAKKVALLNQETRWGSTYAMIDRLIELRSFIEEMADMGNENLNLSSFEWEHAISLRDLLMKAHLITKSLQFENLTPGYFYRKWSGLKLFYQDHGSSLADDFLHSMQKREEELLGNGLLLAAVLSDVTNMDLLPPDHEIKGKETLINLVLRIKGLEDEKKEATVPDLEVSDSDSDEEFRAVRKKLKLNKGTEGPSVFDLTGKEDNINLTPPPTATR